MRTRRVVRDGRTHGKKLTIIINLTQDVIAQEPRGETTRAKFTKQFRRRRTRETVSTRTWAEFPATKFVIDEQYLSNYPTCTFTVYSRRWYYNWFNIPTHTMLFLSVASPPDVFQHDLLYVRTQRTYIYVYACRNVRPDFVCSNVIEYDLENNNSCLRDINLHRTYTLVLSSRDTELVNAYVHAK